MGIEAWYMDDSDADQRLEHRLNPNQPVSLDDLSQVCKRRGRLRVIWGERRGSRLLDDWRDLLVAP